jgi:hypothetical protein
MLASFLYEHEYVRAGNTLARDIGLYAEATGSNYNARPPWQCF